MSCSLRSPSKIRFLRPRACRQCIWGLIATPILVADAMQKRVLDCSGCRPGKLLPDRWTSAKNVHSDGMAAVTVSGELFWLASPTAASECIWRQVIRVSASLLDLGIHPLKISMPAMMPKAIGAKSPGVGTAASAVGGRHSFPQRPPLRRIRQDRGWSRNSSF